MDACGGAYQPKQRRKHYITGPQWAASYEGHALFHAPTRHPVPFETVIAEYEKIGIGHWCTHDTDVLSYDEVGKDAQWETVGRIKGSLKKHGLKCSMVTTETFHHAVFASGSGDCPGRRQNIQSAASRAGSQLPSRALAAAMNPK